MPKEFKDFLSISRAKDKEQQLLDILLLGRSVEPDTLLAAVRRANASGSPTYQLVCFYLNVNTPADVDQSPPGITVEHIDLTEYDRLMESEDHDE